MNNENCVPQPSDPTITEKIERIGSIVNEVAAIANDISNKIYGNVSTVCEKGCGPVSNCIETHLRDIHSKSCDAREVLLRILDSL